MEKHPDRCCEAKNIKFTLMKDYTPSSRPFCLDTLIPMAMLVLEAPLKLGFEEL